MAILKTFLAIGIAILFAVFIGYGVYVLYEPPRYDYQQSNCSMEFNCQKFYDDCYAKYTNNGTIQEKPYPNDCYSEISNNPEYQRCMMAQQDCNDAYLKTTDRYRHARNSFYILIIVGILAILAGMRLSKLEGIGSGLVGGGVLVVLWSLPYTADFWLTWNKWVKWLAIGLVLAILVYTGYKRVENKFASPKKKTSATNASKRKRRKKR